MIYKFEVTGEQLAVLAEALASMPYAKVATLIDELRKQVAAQQQREQEVQ